MARLTRLCPVGIPQHIIQRGNNRQVCFNGDEDMAAYANWLKEFAEKYQVKIHA
jgi:putative transposase